MIEESGRITTVESDSFWVETIQRSACQVCVAEKGCGQKLLNRLSGKTALIRVLPGNCDLQSLKAHEQVLIGIPEDVVVKGTLLVYLLPLLSMIGAVLIGAFVISLHDSIVLASALMGFLFGGLIVRAHSWLNKNNRRVQPVLLARLVESSERNT
ncbi:SoxR reducing system RseC family protein [Porticoccus sp.]|uniref:SoxR reducing system RseC family protein n=1 Tax=Porticoccus sp. TaxID=2024853 RepID=UPI003F69DF72